MFITCYKIKTSAPKSLSETRNLKVQHIQYVRCEQRNNRKSLNDKVDEMKSRFRQKSF
jgi:hypothetical protein